MEHYAGLEVSLELTSVCIVDERGAIVREAKVASEPEALIGFLRAQELEIGRVGLEAGPLSQWLQARLVGAGFETVLLETRHVKAGFGGDDREDRPARRARHCPIAAARLVPARARQVGERSGGARVADRTPRKYQSGELDVTGSITKVGDRMVRTGLYEAASVMLTRAVRFSSLKAWAMTVARRRGTKKAKVALARKLGVILHRMWVDGTSFRWSSEETAIA